MTNELQEPIIQAEKVSQEDTGEYPIADVIPSDKKTCLPDMDRSDQGDRTEYTEHTTECCDNCCSDDNDEIWLCCCLFCLLNNN